MSRESAHSHILRLPRFFLWQESSKRQKLINYNYNNFKGTFTGKCACCPRHA